MSESSGSSNTDPRPGQQSSGNVSTDVGPDTVVTMAILDHKLGGMREHFDDRIDRLAGTIEKLSNVITAFTGEETSKGKETQLGSGSVSRDRQVKETPGTACKLGDALTQFCQPKPILISSTMAADFDATAKKIKVYNGPIRTRGQLVDDWVEQFSDWFDSQVSSPFIPELATQVLRLFDTAIAKDQDVLEKVLQLRRRESETKGPMAWSTVVNYLHYNMMP